MLDHLDTLDLGFKVVADSHQDSSISVVRMPGSRVVAEYMDGSKDKRFTYFIQVKGKDLERVKAVNALEKISDNLIELESLPSENDSYEFNEIDITNEPYHATQDDQGFIYFRMTIQAELYFK